jgi:hypothetical protein
MTTGDTQKLTAIVEPSNATYPAVIWSSSNTNVVTVDQSGNVTAVGTAGETTGTAIITAKVIEGDYDTCTVTVNPFITSVKIPDTLRLEAKESFRLTAEIEPQDAPNKNLTWSSSNASVAIVSLDGTVTGIANGTTIITVKTADGSKTTSCAVTVSVRTDTLDFAKILQTLPLGFINFSEFNNKFGNFLEPGISGSATSVTLEVILDKGVKKLLVKSFNWGGFGLNFNNDAIKFQAGDKIEIKGRNVSGGHIILDLNQGQIDGWWHPLQGWGVWSAPEDFHKTFTLTAFDAEKIKDRGDINIKVSGLEPWWGVLNEADRKEYPNGIGSFIVEQIKILKF